MESSYAGTLRILRTAKDLTQYELGRQVGKTQRYISDIERGRALPSAELHVAIQDALGLTPAEAFHFGHTLPTYNGSLSAAQTIGANSFNHAREGWESALDEGNPKLVAAWARAGSELAETAAEKATASLMLANAYSMQENLEGAEHHYKEAYRHTKDPGERDLIEANIAHTMYREGYVGPAKRMAKDLRSSECERAAAHSSVTYPRCVLDELEDAGTNLSREQAEEVFRDLEYAEMTYEDLGYTAMAEWTRMFRCRARVARGDDRNEALVELRRIRDGALASGHGNNFVQASLEIYRINVDKEEAAPLSEVVEAKGYQLIANAMAKIARRASAIAVLAVCIGSSALTGTLTISDNPAFGPNELEQMSM